MTAAKGGATAGPGEDGFERAYVADVGPNEREARTALQLTETPLLEPNVVGVIQVVETDDLVPLAEQKLGNLRADEACGAGDEIAIHFSPEDVTPARRRRTPGELISPSWPRGSVPPAEVDDGPHDSCDLAP